MFISPTRNCVIQPDGGMGKKILGMVCLPLVSLGLFFSSDSTEIFFYLEPGLPTGVERRDIGSCQFGLHLAFCLTVVPCQLSR